MIGMKYVSDRSSKVYVSVSVRRSRLAALRAAPRAWLRQSQVTARSAARSIKARKYSNLG